MHDHPPLHFLVAVYFDPRDVWVGFFFKKWNPLNLYVCPLPTLVIHIKRVKLDNPKDM